MLTKKDENGGLYLYGIVRAGDVSDLGPIGLEVGGHPGQVYPVVVDDIGAVVSRFPVKERLMPLRKHLDAQHRVLRELTKARGGVLPLRFGHVVPGERALRRILSRKQGEISRELSHLGGRVEMALQVSWDIVNIFDYMAMQDPELSKMRDELYGGGRQPSRDEQIDLGRKFAGRLEEERRRHVQQVTDAIGPYVVDIHEEPPKGERVVMSLAMLVEASKLDAFDAKIVEVAKTFSDAFLFRTIGPLPPFHFVGIELGESEGEEVV